MPALWSVIYKHLIVLSKYNMVAQLLEYFVSDMSGTTMKNKTIYVVGRHSMAAPDARILCGPTDILLRPERRIDFNP